MRLKQFLKDGDRKYNDPFYDTTDIQASQKVGIPVDILRAIRLSGEKSNENQVSSSGARGVYQFIPSVRSSVLKKYGVDAWDPNQSSLAAAYLLKESANRNKGNYIDAIREYHGGIDRKNWGKVNQAYINRVQSFLGNNNKDYTNSQSIMDYSNAMRQGLQDIFITPELKTFNPLFNTPTQDQMSQYLEYQKLEQERLQQEQNKAIQEKQNQQIQQALLLKEQEKKQMLDMIPQLQSVAESSNIKPNFLQKGGKLLYQQWEEKTGTKWSEASKMGLTDGTLENNLKLLNRLQDEQYVQNLNKDITQSHKSDSETHVETTEEPKTQQFEEMQSRAFIPKVELEKEYSSWSKSKQEVQDSNINIDSLEKQNLVKISRKNGKPELDKNGNYMYKIISEDYKNQFNDWIDTLNSVRNSPNGIINPDYSNPQVVKENSIQNNDPDVWDKIQEAVYNTSDYITQGASQVSDYIKDKGQQVYNYIDRRVDDSEVRTSVKLDSKPVENKKSEKKQPLISDNINITGIQVGDGFAGSGVINLKDNKFESRNRGEISDVENGRGVAITLFKPMLENKNSYKDFKYVIGLNKDGSSEILEREKVGFNKTKSISGIEEMPFDKIKTKNINGKQYIHIKDTPDFNRKIVDIEGYNSGIGIDKTDQEWILIDESNKYSKLLGGKILIQAGDEQVLVNGSFKDMYDVYNKLKETTKTKPRVFKIDNGSFNTSYFKKEGNINSEDLKKHQNRNDRGGHSLILLNK